MHPADLETILTDYVDVLRAARPELAINSCQGIFTGQFNIILIVNEEWIFRFPRYEEEIQRAAAEARLLTRLRGRLPLPIPHPAHIHLDPPISGQAFYGYRRLPGEPLLRPLVAQLRAEGRLGPLAKSLVDFLRALHAIPPADLELPTQIADQRDEYARMYQEVRKKLFPAMRPDARRSVADHYEAYLDDSALHVFTPVPRHGDFGGSNILYDPARAEVSGVIDFSGCALGDPAADLASVSTLGEDLFTRILDNYAPDSSSRTALIARARFIRGTFALLEALDGLRTGDRKAYESGMSSYV